MRAAAAWMGFAAVGVGAACGAWLRWWLGLRLNPLFPTVPLGTLASNLIGGYLVGVAVGVFTQNQGLAPEWRLFAITGFLGGLTTFSTFSAEVVTLLSRGQVHWAIATATAHLAGSLALTALGMATVRAIG
jgi:CrcB protein